jgi:hypothetical protein
MKIVSDMNGIDEYGVSGQPPVISKVGDVTAI